MILLILILFFQSTDIPVYAIKTETIYARVLFEQTYLYKTPTENNSIENIYFELPKTYFVEILNKENDFYFVRYSSFKGYVKKDTIQAVNETPQMPFLININFRVYAQMSENLWSMPTSENPSNIIAKIPPLTENIEYIGKITGECLIEDRTNIWYFCKFSSDRDYYGYVYSDFCDKMPLIANNTEQLTYINNPTFEENVETINAIPENNKAVGIIIAILSVPATIFVLMVLKGSKIIHKEKIKHKEVVDY